MVFTFLENALNLDNVFKILFPPTAERSGKNKDLLNQNSIRKNKEGFEH